MPGARSVCGGEFAYERRARERAQGSLAASSAALLGALAVVASSWLLAVAAAGEPTQYVPARVGGWPPWLSGPLRAFEAGLGSGTFEALTLAMCGGYLL